ncbi:MAG: hypothetical protein HKN79_11205, partial [Flavobacteriales bacterium]|nr:hypothetical protein [Flavobacteriales bacterium]
IKVPEELLSSQDKKKGHSPLMYFPSDGSKQIIVSSYGKGEHLDLYYVNRTSSVGYTEPVKLPGVVNSPFDEDFPFLHADGRTLYFSSKGHNSMGGYDIFQAERNLSTGVFENPVNLDFAISSPDDDIFYVVDQDTRLAHFASTRNSEEGRLHVYQVAVRAAPLELAIVKGTLDNSSGGSRKAQIKVIDASTNEELGAYRTDANGNYLIDLPGAGKYKFFIDVEDSQITHTGLVDVPSFGKMRAFEQDMELVDVSNQEKLVIKNNFDTEPTEDVMVLAQEILKNKAELEVNYDEESLAEAESAPLSPQDMAIQAGFSQDTPMETILETAYAQAAAVSEQVMLESEERDQAYGRAQAKLTQAEALTQEANTLYTELQSTQEQGARDRLLVATSLKRLEAEKLTREAEVALSLAQQMDIMVKENESTKSRLIQRNDAIELALQEGKGQEAVELLKDVKRSEDKGSGMVDALETSTKSSLELNRESQQTLSRLERIQEDRNRVQTTILTKENTLARTKKQKEKKAIEAELTALRSELSDLEAQVERKSSELEEMQVSSDIATSSAELLEQMRLGEDPDMLSVQKVETTSEGLETTTAGIVSVKQSQEEIILKDQEIAMILARSPEILSGYRPEQQVLMSRFTEMDFADVELPVGSMDTSDSDMADEELESASTSESGSVSNEEVDVQEQSTQEVNTLTGQESDPGSEEELASAPSGMTSSMNTDELLLEIRADYPSARADIDSSDMDPVEKAQAKIDLNRAAIQYVEQEILLTRYSPGYAEDEAKQEKVTRMRELVDDLKTDMLFIAKESEVPDEELPAVASRGGDALNILQRVSADEGLSEKVEAHYAALAEINSEESSTDIVQLSSRAKQHVEFIQELYEEREGMQSDESIDPEVRTALEEFIQLKEEELERDVDLWQEATDVEFSEAEKTIATHSSTYLAERSLAQAQGAQAAINALNYKKAQDLLAEVDEGDQARWTSEEIQQLEEVSTSEYVADVASEEEDAQETSSAPVRAETVKSLIASPFDLKFLGENEKWSKELFDNRRSRKESMALQEVMANVQWDELTSEEVMENEVEIADVLQSPIEEELLWKEKVLQIANRKGTGFVEVADVMAEAYTLDQTASEYRKKAAEATVLSEKHDFTNKALLLGLSSLNKMEEAIALEVHLSKAKPIEEFQFQEALVIDQAMFTEGDIVAVEQEADSTSTLADIASEGERPAEGSVQEEEDALTEDSSDTLSDETAESATNDTTDESQILDDPELANAPSISASEDIDGIERISSSIAVQRYPELSAQLTDQKIRPVLDLQAEMLTREAMVENYGFESDERASQLNEDEIQMMRQNETELAGLTNYETELDATLENYKTELGTRKVQLAEVIDVIADQGSTAELEYEKSRLTAEVQVIQSYIDQAEANQVEIAQEKENIRAVQEAALVNAATTRAIEDESVAMEAEIDPEEEESIPDPIGEVEEVPSNPIEEVVEAPEPAVSPVLNEYGIPEVLVADVFTVRTDKPARTEGIPVNVPLPSGTVYQVQVGAFRNPIPNELFSEFDPIVGEQISS